MIENGHLHPEMLITHRFALNNYREALSTVTTKSRSRAIKVIFDYALLPASVVPNVRATARQRRPVTTTATWPQEEHSAHEESFLSTPPDEHFVQPTSPFAPEPVEIPLPIPQSSIPETEQPPVFSADEQPTLEDQSETTPTVISKPGRARKSARSQKTTEDIQEITEDVQTPIEAIGNSAGTNQAADTLEEEKEE